MSIHQDMTEAEVARGRAALIASRHPVHIRRRFFCLHLPVLAVLAVAYIVASARTQTLTSNGLALLFVALIGLGVLAMAWDAGDHPTERGDR